MIDDNLRWLLSFYRGSELAGALFFGQLGRRLDPGRIQIDITHHFADEAQHARWWTEALEALGAEPLTLAGNYQDRYLREAGLPANLMEVLAVTQVFEQRVIRQYHRHRAAQALPQVVAATLDRILLDERRHIAWVRAALAAQRHVLGDEAVDAALARYRAADERIHAALLAEHAGRVRELA